ncbi:DDE-domain-containing protein, partial [Didymella exigua CBS 183.55]
MIRNFASAVAQETLSDSWVTRFLHRHNNCLLPRWATAMDSNRHYAESYTKYKQYFDIPYSKIDEYNIEPENTYNMDEKGFMIGVIGRSKRVFNKLQYERKEVRQSIQAGNREWVTVLACVCADGSALPPGIIYEAAGPAIRSSWVDDIKPEQHSAHFTTSPTGWTNNNVGLAWLEQVFDRYTKQKSRVQYRLLVVDGHGSHITMEFIKYCDDHRILLAILPPHSTQTLQPLDVVCFAPLAHFYTIELTEYLQQSLGWLPVKKGDFFPLFWRAWVKSFTESTVLSSFRVTGICP